MRSPEGLMGPKTWRRGAALLSALAIVLALGCKHATVPEPDAPSDVKTEPARPPPGTRAETWPEVRGGGTDLFPRAASTIEGAPLTPDLPPPHPPDAQVPLRSHRDDM